VGGAAGGGADGGSHGGAGGGPREAADMILNAKKAVFLFKRSALTARAVALIGYAAALSGHAGGIIKLCPGANLQGLINLGIGRREELMRAVEEGKIRGLFVFGDEIAGLHLWNVDFMAVHDFHITEAAKQANVILPASTFLEADGSITAYDNKPRILNKAVACPVAWDNAAQLKALAAL